MPNIRGGSVRLSAVGVLFHQIFLDFFQFFLKDLVVDCVFFAPRFPLRVGLRGIGGYFTAVYGLESIGLSFQFGA